MVRIVRLHKSNRMELKACEEDKLICSERRKREDRTRIVGLRVVYPSVAAPWDGKRRSAEEREAGQSQSWKKDCNQFRVRL